MSQLNKSNTFDNTNILLDRVKIAYKLTTDAELARFLHVNASTVATWRKKTTMKYDRIIEYTRELNLNWLFFGEGPKWSDSVGETASATSRRESMEEPEVPYYKSVLPSSKGGIAPEEETGTTYLALPTSFIHKELEANPSDLFLMRVVGDVMEPALRDREFILVQRSVSRPYTGRIYLIRLNESLLCKRIHEEPDGRLRLMSDNSRYEDQWLTPGHHTFEIIGRVVWHGRKL